MRHRPFLKLSSLFLLIAAAPAAAQTGAKTGGYATPPAPIAQILDTPPPPTPSVSPRRDTIALLGRANLPPIAELAEPDLKLAGYRINPRNNGPANSRVAWLNALSFQPVGRGAPRAVALPAGMRFTSASWSPDGSRLAFLVDRSAGLELWVADAATAKARRLTSATVNAAFGSSYEWLPDSSGLIVRMVPAGRGAAPRTGGAPDGPIVQENAGRAAPVRTYQDLLGNPSDEALFEHYFTSQLTLVPVNGSAPRPIGQPGLIWGSSVSPDGRYLLITRAKRPFSYVVPAALFPTEISVTDLNGKAVHKLADLPLRDDVPPQFDAVAPGPRSAHWRSDRPATLAWVEAQDGGDAKREASIRDRVFMLDAPFTSEPRRLVDLQDRYSGILWGRDDYAMVFSQWWNTRRERRLAVNPGVPGKGRLLIERNFQDRYNDPGTPVMRPNAQGRLVMHFTADGRGVFMSAPGASREGEFPFLARMDLDSGKTDRLWQAKMPYYESVVALLDDNGERLLTRRESRIDPPNLFLRSRSGGESVQLTNFPDPAPQLAGVTQKLVTYKRADGVDLSGTLYLPAGYDQTRDGPLPLLMWAYPTEFTDPAVAGQVVDTQNRFTRPGGTSHLFLLTQGYAVLDNPTMPIVGANGAEPNDTYVEQLVSSAQAAVDAVVAMGVADRDRIAVGGHSYGAFMTANLLAHSDLFRTGIARSGAYNRTLTPFGFQAEQRTYWEAVDTYTQMSPFTHVQKIKEPILLIHGEADDNSGTFPIQSERFYAALKGQGATVRYVVLPLEAHGYRARESVGHTLWEMTRWLDQYLKRAPARTAARAAGGGE
ncbi:MAG TPA: prolyl oligopeptidase family serine peptidase [Allosphingosinicella sp.]|nr:prolyl oligopeptidase family serine peptidase [Allosphingosinicella sp.]